MVLNKENHRSFVSLLISLLAHLCCVLLLLSIIVTISREYEFFINFLVGILSFFSRIE